MTTYETPCRVCKKNTVRVNIEENGIFTTAYLLDVATCDTCLVERYRPPPRRPARTRSPASPATPARLPHPDD